MPRKTNPFATAATHPPHLTIETLDMTSNPFLSAFETPFGSVPFDKIKNEHFLPAIEEGIKIGKAEIQQIIENPEPANFQNTIEALENTGELADTVSSVFFNLNSAETNDEIQALAQKISPLLTAYGNDIMLNSQLFERVKQAKESTDPNKLTAEQKTLLEKTYKSFVRNGALLSDSDKEKLRAIDTEKASLSLTFGENVLAESNAFVMHITDENDLKGLPESALEAAAQTAKEKELSGWAVTLDYPSYIPFMTHATNRDLREKLYKAFVSKAFKGDDKDNQAIVKKIATLRFERAKLLGYESHAHFVLEERMAESPERVESFLRDMLDRAKPFARREVEELQAYADSLNGPNPLQRWDVTFYAEKLRKERYSIDDELLKPYFKLENVIAGVFETASRLFGLRFKEITNIPTYHQEVSTYEVTDENGKHIALFYADFFPRSGKRQGAWMTSFRDQKRLNNEDIRPHISNVCNFTKPTATKPSLLTFNEVTTLFHEFGHGLHGMLANGNYSSLSGTNVYWDFVELPSQILENWCYEKECLDLFAKHYETGDTIPEELIERIKASANFQSGLATLRQVSFGLLDMSYHSTDPSNITDLQAHERAAISEADLFPKVDENCSSCQFSHIFQGGYSSGYYSYKWAEVLDADAFEAFKQNGIFNQETAQKFKEHILSAGGSEHPSILYKRFRGADPDPAALLRREGLVELEAS